MGLFDLTIIISIVIISYIMYIIMDLRLVASLYSWSLYVWSLFIILVIISLFRPTFRYIIYIFLIFYYNNVKLLIDVSTNIYKIYKNGKQKDNFLIRNMCTNILNDNFRFIHNFNNIPKIPTIFVCNYIHDRIENIALFTFPINICPIFASALTSLNNIATPIIFREDKDSNYNKIKNKISTVHNKGFHIFSYIETAYSSIDKNGIGKLRSGMFSIAKELGITITPVVIDRIHYSNFSIINKQNFQIYIGESIHVTDIKNDMYNTKKLFRTKINEFLCQKYNNVF